MQHTPTFKRLAALAALCCIVAAAGLALAAGAYRVVSANEPGVFHATGVDAGRLAAVLAEGAVPATGTVIIKRISTAGGVVGTNTLGTYTATGGVINATIAAGTDIWLLAGDKLLREGTVTNACPVRLIIAQSP